MKKLVPFSKFLAENPKPTNDVYLFIGRHAWKKSRAFQVQRPGTLCLPPYHEPTLYRWPVDGCDILVYDTSGCDKDYVRDLAQCLFDYEANIVRYISPDFLMTVFKKEF
jgi:hypothetical protein